MQEMSTLLQMSGPVANAIALPGQRESKSRGNKGRTGLVAGEGAWSDAAGCSARRLGQV